MLGISLLLERINKMPLQDGNHIVLVDANTIELVDVNTIKLFEVILPEDFEFNKETTIIGGKDTKKISKTSGIPRIGGSAGIG